MRVIRIIFQKKSFKHLNKNLKLRRNTVRDIATGLVVEIIGCRKELGPVSRKMTLEN